MGNRSESCWEKYFILEEDYFAVNFISNLSFFIIFIENHKTYFDFLRNCSDLKTLRNLASIRKLDVKIVF